MESAEGLCAGLATTTLRVPLRVTLSTGSNWAHLQQYHNWCTYYFLHSLHHYAAVGLWLYVPRLIIRQVLGAQPYVE